MSFSSDMNGFSQRQLNDFYRIKNENKAEYAEVDFTVDDYEAKEIFGNGMSGNGAYDEACFFDGNGNGYVDFAEENIYEFGGNGFDYTEDEAEASYNSYIGSYDMTITEDDDNNKTFEG